MSTPPTLILLGISVKVRQLLLQLRLLLCHDCVVVSDLLHGVHQLFNEFLVPVLSLPDVLLLQALGRYFTSCAALGLVTSVSSCCLSSAGGVLLDLGSLTEGHCFFFPRSAVAPVHMRCNCTRAAIGGDAELIIPCHRRCSSEIAPFGCDFSCAGSMHFHNLCGSWSMDHMRFAQPYLTYLPSKMWEEHGNTVR